MVVAETRARTPVYARDLKAASAMTALLLRAMEPNLVQTLEGSPALVHGGPFANIAHGCNSIVATRGGAAARRLRRHRGGLRRRPRRGEVLQHQMPAGGAEAGGGGRGGDGARAEDERRRRQVRARRRRTSRRCGAACPISSAMSRTSRKFGLEPVVAINRFDSDTEAELALVRDAMQARRAGGRRQRKLGAGRGGRRRAGGSRARRDRPRPRRVPPALSRRHAAAREDRTSSPAKSTAPRTSSPTPA